MVEKKIIVAVGAVILNANNEVLLVKHVPERGGFWQGKWICPGGGLKPGESIQDGIKREIREETGLEIILKKKLVPFERIVWSSGRLILHVIYIDYLAELSDGYFSPGSDVGEGLWASRKHVNEIRDELHDDTKKLLETAGFI